MIERVARALAACEYDSGDFWDRLPEDDFEKRMRQRAGEDNCPSSVKVQLRSDARAVIEAMREPTKQMAAVGREAVSDFSPDDAPSSKTTDRDSLAWTVTAEGVAENAWRLMIDAAVKESAE